MENWKKTFAIIWTGQLFSLLGSSVAGYAVVFWLGLESGSARTLAWAAVATLLPQIVIGPFAGVYVDRWNRKRTMILSDGFIALCSLLLAVLFREGAVSYGYVYALLACRSAGSAFHIPAMQASVPLLAPVSELTRIAGVDQVIRSVNTIAAPMLGGLLLGLLPMGAILMLDVAGAIIACTSLLLVSIPNPEKRPEGRESIWRDMRDGMRAVRDKPGMTPLFLLSIAMWFFVMPTKVLYPLMATQYFGGGALEMSLVETAWGVGALAGGAVMGWKKYRVNKVVLIGLMYLGMGGYLVGCGLLGAGMFSLFCLLAALWGVMGAVYGSCFVSLVQTHIEAGTLGRVFSVYSSVSLLPALPGMLGTGWIVCHIGLSGTFIMAGTATLVIGVISFAFPRIKELGETVRTYGQD